ncbi:MULTISPECIES: TadE family type IV pilus minor pilin [Microbacterium]|uniref:TadE family type IV pilus minor pilin n=1 Tax=Microbacterium TaxID=33882 RepID=UPI00278B3DA7|nr:MULTISPECIES: TadE family type IV pilus minor pilin [Microbacterium]MDQ1084741.1 Flp pilus assembly protein TadG [Microbacterium sp. SORGH_AS_0344]MDQ1169982.1 Flp pilus assembly protein TadG [Microbacterium proteolyticum]
MIRRVLDDRGAVTAEFAVAVPAVLVVLTLGVGVLGSAAATVRLQHAATEAARLVGRGDDAALAPLTGSGATASMDRRDGLVCVSASAAVPGPLPLPPVTASACALDGGR